ncbi:unnamed protein product [Cylicocyclus nassatus]|uniref:Methyltransferase-like protein 13 n=1 Tax=Cylicocyclus nassatus TaxID=53992 RepID=A0AA36MF91_CYLNA|nr:unnamed protein product [Cylicocyclus nassatus]
MLKLLNWLKRFAIHLFLILIAVYIATQYGHHWGITKRTTRKTEDIKRAVAVQNERTIAKVCDADKCYLITDHAYLEDENLIVERYTKVREYSEVRITAVELETPQELTWKNFNTKQWNVNKLFIKDVYARAMIAVPFMTEALKFDPEDYQNVLMVGLGGGVMNNFLTVVDFIKVNLTTVELDPLMVKAAKGWFAVEESDTNKIFVQDGIVFVANAVKRGDRYKSIILDACHNDDAPTVCPVPEFTKDEVIKHMSNLLDNDGVLTVNILCLRDIIGTENTLLETYRQHFKTCYLLRFKEDQRLLVCTNREHWSFEEQRDYFLKNLWTVDDRFDFKLYDIIRES